MNNFRDLSETNKSIRSNIIYRSAQLNSSSTYSLLYKYKIKTIIDLRTSSEIKDTIVHKKILFNNQISFYNVPIAYEKAKTIYEGTPMESVYQFFARDSTSEIRNVLNIVLNEQIPLLIHCKHGVDRTGIIVAILLLICNTPKTEILKDYMQSQNGVVQKHLEIFLDIIGDYGNIDDFLISENFTSNNIFALRSKLMK